MRVTVIGGTGFIGPYVVRALAAQGHEVTVFHRGRHNVEVAASVRDVRHPDAAFPVTRFPRDLLERDCDLVIHMVAMGEADARAAADAFRGRAARIVALSSGDVYRAYGCFTGLEPGPVEHRLLREDSALRAVLFPYRAKANLPDGFVRSYEKVLVERVLMSARDLPATILRLPKVYGPGGNADLATMYAFRNHPSWRWTHGYVENVAAAIVLAVTDPRAAGCIFNVGEAYTPTISERLASLPPSDVPVSTDASLNFAHHIVYDTARIRGELGYAEPVSYEEGLRRTLARGVE